MTRKLQQKTKELSLVDSLAKQIRATYILERDRFERELCNRNDYKPGPWWDGGRCRNGSVRKPIWPRIAQAVVDYKVEDPGDYIRYHFDERWTLPPKAPMPNHLSSEKWLKKYRSGLPERQRLAKRRAQIDLASMADNAQMCLFELDQELEYFESGDEWSNEEKLRFALQGGDSPCELPYLFSYCSAVACGLTEYAQEIEYLAAYEYMCNRPAFDAAWGVFIPERLRENAVKLSAIAIDRLLGGR